MIKLLKSKFYDENGSMEQVLVTILLLIIGIGLFINLSSWLGTKNIEMTDVATIKIDTAITENKN